MLGVLLSESFGVATDELGRISADEGSGTSMSLSLLTLKLAAIDAIIDAIEFIDAFIDTFIERQLRLTENECNVGAQAFWWIIG